MINMWEKYAKNVETKVGLKSGKVIFCNFITSLLLTLREILFSLALLFSRCKKVTLLP